MAIRRIAIYLSASSDDVREGHWLAVADPQETYTLPISGRWKSLLGIDSHTMTAQNDRINWRRHHDLISPGAVTRAEFAAHRLASLLQSSQSRAWLMEAGETNHR